MKTPTELQTELEALSAQVARLEHTELTPDGLTLLDVALLSRKVDLLREELSAISTSIADSPAPLPNSQTTPSALPDAAPTQIPRNSQPLPLQSSATDLQEQSNPDTSQTSPEQKGRPMPYTPPEYTNSAQSTSDARKRVLAARDSMKNYDDANHAGPTQTSPLPPRSRLTERNIGKYLIGVLASFLVLLAAGTAISSFWQYVPSAAKFAAFLAAGIMCEYIGWKQLRKTGTQNGFWTSLTGLGAAMSFVALVLGSSYWGLFPAAPAGIFLILWFVANFVLACIADSNVFFAVTYIGGIVAIRLVLEVLPRGQEMEIVFSLIAAAVYMIGKLGSVYTKKPILPLLNMCFLWSVFINIQSILISIPTRHSYYSDTYLPMNCMVYIPDILIVLGLFCAAALLIESSHAWAKTWVFPRAGSVILPFLAAVTAAVACGNAANYAPGIWGVQNNALESLIFLAIVVGAGIFSKKKNRRSYLLGVSLVSSFALMVLSEEYLLHAAILPALTALILIAVPALRKDKYVKTSAVMIYIGGLFALLGIPRYPPSELSLFAGALLMMAVPAVNYLFICLRKDGVFPALEQILGIVGIAVCCGKLFDCYGLSELYWIVILAAMSLAHHFLLPDKYRQEPRSDGEAFLAKFISCFIAGFACLAAYFGRSFMPSHADMACCTAILMAYSFAAVYLALRSSMTSSIIAAAVFCHINLFYLTSLWNEDASIAASFLGLMLAAVFIAIGFWQKKKTVRVTGLTMMILYVLKIALVDVSMDGELGSRALILLLGGIVCYGVSFAYNKLDKLFGETDGSDMLE